MTAHVMVVLGTRPEAIKQAPVVHALRAHPDAPRVTVVSTGQHREMLRAVLPMLELEIDIDLDLMRPDQSLAELTARCVAAIDALLVELRPDVVVVQGDTTTAMAAGLAAFERRIDVAHVEAGLRSGSLDEPFPEEANRRVLDIFARWLFAPTEHAAALLRAEGVMPQRIFVTGNTVVDALAHVRDRVAGTPPSVAGLAPEVLRDGERLVLVTCHRRESFGEGIDHIAHALAELAGSHPDHHFVYPVHLNPHVFGPMHAVLDAFANVHLVPPLDYAGLVRVLERAHLVLTDSGGLQEEAPSFGVPVLVMRHVTERPEGIEAGCARLVGSETDAIVDAARTLLDDPVAWAAMAHVANPYGDGEAGRRIAEVLMRDLSTARREGTSTGAPAA